MRNQRNQLYEILNFEILAVCMYFQEINVTFPDLDLPVFVQGNDFSLTL